MKKKSIGIKKHYLEKRKEIMEKNHFKVEDVFGDIIRKNKTSQDEIIKQKNVFLAKMM